MMAQSPIVFVSSTIVDLINERTAAELAIRKLNCEPMMSDKTFIASNNSTIDKCVALVRECDIYILVLGERYGYELRDGKSITELEWDTACQYNRPRIVFNLKYLHKEEKQERFAKKVGDVYLGRFWKEVTNVFELSEEIEKSLLLLISEEKVRRQKITEPLTLGLIEIDFPQFIYHGEFNFKREEIIGKANILGVAMGRNSDTRKVVFSALKQAGVKFGGDWTHFGTRLVSFYDLRDVQIPLSSIVERGTIERERTNDFFNLDEDYLNIFKALLKYCFKQKMYHANIEWVYEDKLFRFKALNDNLETRIESWKGEKVATRKVFERITNIYNGKDYSYCKHLAFRVSFLEIDRKWYLSILPDWSFTWDGKKKYFRDAEKVKWLKEQEHNQQVFNHFRFIASFIKEWDYNLYNEKYPLIHFGELLHLNGYPVLKDEEWLKKERSVFVKRLKLDPDQISLELHV